MFGFRCALKVITPLSQWLYFLWVECVLLFFFYLFWFQFGCARLTPNIFKSLRPDWSSNTNQLRCVNSRVCETHFVKCLFYLIARADVILAPHNLAAFLCECAVMVPGQLTTSWTRRGGSFLHQFHFEEAISDTQVSLAKGKLERLLFPVVCWKIFIHYPSPPLPHPPPLRRFHHAPTSTGTRWYGRIQFLLLGHVQKYFFVASNDPNVAEKRQPWKSSRGQRNAALVCLWKDTFDYMMIKVHVCFCEPSSEARVCTCGSFSLLSTACVGTHVGTRRRRDC